MIYFYYSSIFCQKQNPLRCKSTAFFYINRIYFQKYDKNKFLFDFSADFCSFYRIVRFIKRKIEKQKINILDKINILLKIIFITKTYYKLCLLLFFFIFIVYP